MSNHYNTPICCDDFMKLRASVYVPELTYYVFQCEFCGKISDCSEYDLEEFAQDKENAQ